MNKTFKKYSILMFVLLLSFALAGCAHPKDSVTGFLAAIKNGDINKASTFEVSSSDKNFKFTDSEQEKLVKAMFSTITYTIEKTSTSGSSSTVTIKLTAADTSKISTKLQKEFLEEETKNVANGKKIDQDSMVKDYDNKLINAIKNSNAEKKTTNVTFKLVKKDGKWLIQDSSNFCNAFVSADK